MLAAVEEAQPLESHINIFLSFLRGFNLGQRYLGQLLNFVLRKKFHRLFRELDLQQRPLVASTLKSAQNQLRLGHYGTVVENIIEAGCGH